MAEKSFGVKEVNLIGASGTPTITSPNNLNLNAVNVAISTNVSIGGTLTVSGSLSIGGTITYEDVTNVDSVGVVTARNGLNVSGGNVTIAKDIDVDGHTNLDNVNISGITTFANNVHAANVFTSYLSSTSGLVAPYADIDDYVDVGSNIKLGNAGVVTATSFSGSGANLTGIAVTEAPVVDYTITADGGSNYYFHGGGVDETDGNPDLYLIRGQKYRFNNTTGSGHPFRFTSTGNANAAYSNGVTGTESGVQFWTIPYDAPAKLFYVCTIHSGMVGNIYIRGANGQNDNVGVTTFANITVNNINGTPDINVGTGEADIYSTGSGDQLSLRLLNSDASAGNKIGIYFGPANNVAGAYIKGVAESDFTSTANRDAGLEFGTRLNANFLAPLKISAAGYVTKPLTPAFRAGLSSDVNPGANGTIVFNYVTSPTHFNQGGHYSNSTGAFTAPIAGVYNFYTQVLWENVSDGQNMADAIWVYYNASGGASGGTLVSYDARRAEYIQNETGNAGYYGAFTTLLFYMAANSSIYVRNARSLTVHGNANFTFFQGYLIG